MGREPLRTLLAYGLMLSVVVPLISAEPENKVRKELPMKLKVVTDKKRYDVDDAVMFVASFSCFDDGRIQLQFSEGGCGSMYFYAITEPVGHKANTVCKPMHSCQYASEDVQKLMLRGTWPRSVKQIDDSLPCQMALHLPRKKGIPEGVYKLRIGYTVAAQDKLVSLIKDATGEKVDIDEKFTLLKGAWDGAVLSEPVTITIGPDKDKK